MKPRSMQICYCCCLCRGVRRSALSPPISLFSSCWLPRPREREEGEIARAKSTKRILGRQDFFCPASFLASCRCKNKRSIDILTSGSKSCFLCRRRMPKSFICSLSLLLPREVQQITHVSLWQTTAILGRNIGQIIRMQDKAESLFSFL